MLASPGRRRAEGWRVETPETEGMAGDAFGRVRPAQMPVPCAIRKEGDVRSQVALAKARVTHQTHGRLAPQQVHQPFAKGHGPARAAVRATADDHVTGDDSLSRWERAGVSGGDSLFLWERAAHSLSLRE